MNIVISPTARTAASRHVISPTGQPASCGWTRHFTHLFCGWTRHFTHRAIVISPTGRFCKSLCQFAFRRFPHPVTRARGFLTFKIFNSSRRPQPVDDSKLMQSGKGRAASWGASPPPAPPGLRPSARASRSRPASPGVSLRCTPRASCSPANRGPQRGLSGPPVSAQRPSQNKPQQSSLPSNRSLSGVLLPATLTRNNPPPVQSGGTRSDPSDGKPQQVAAA